jgi:mitochondrial import inner membrane translocase subunit TIM44
VFQFALLLQGAIPDPTILDISDVELADLKMHEENPVVIVQFTVQQIECARDKFGNVVEGSPDNVQRVYYSWAIQQEASGFVGTDGKAYPPRWQLIEMLIRGFHQLL